MTAFTGGPALKRIMDDHRFTLSVAESLTSGNIQAAIGAITGASTFYEGGITAYNLKQKVKLLGVDREHAEQVDCVSQRIAIEMAKGIAERFGSDIGLGTTGYAESNRQNNILEPYAYFAIWKLDPNTLAGQVVVQQLIRGDKLSRIEMQHYVTNVALTALLKYLKSINHTYPMLAVDPAEGR